MIKASEIMTSDPVFVSPEDEVSRATAIMIEKGFNGLPVVDDQGQLVGIICQSDIVAQQKKLPLPSYFTFLDGLISLRSTKALEKEARKIAATTVRQAMTSDPVWVPPDATIETLAALMVDRNFHTLPVVAEGKLVGVVGKEDILRTLAG
ncbi:MAG: CBS domain-containing protein [Deltaproteobacteria bacterium]|nr:CBS domain-containing protein [Deltaproteobacteria bacterium]